MFNLSVDFYLPARGLPESLRPLVTEMRHRDASYDSRRLKQRIQALAGRTVPQHDQADVSGRATRRANLPLRITSAHVLAALTKMLSGRSDR